MAEGRETIPSGPRPPQAVRDPVLPEREDRPGRRRLCPVPRCSFVYLSSGLEFRLRSKQDGTQPSPSWPPFFRETCVGNQGDKSSLRPPPASPTSATGHGGQGGRPRTNLDSPKRAIGYSPKRAIGNRRNVFGKCAFAFAIAAGPTHLRPAVRIHDQNCRGRPVDT